MGAVKLLLAVPEGDGLLGPPEVEDDELLGLREDDGLLAPPAAVAAETSLVEVW